MDFQLITKIIRPEHCDPLFLLRELGRNREHCALLESADRNHGINDFSFLALGKRDLVLIHDGNPLEPFKKTIGRGEEGSLLMMGYIGFLSFESLRHFESLPLKCDEAIPDGYFVLPEVILRIDHKKREVTLMTHSDSEEDLGAIERVVHESPYYDNEINVTAAPLPPQGERLGEGDLREEGRLRFQDDRKKDAKTSAKIALPSTADITAMRMTNREEFCSNVRKVQEEILKGEAFQVVLSQELTMASKADPLNVYEKLRFINPSPYMYYFRTPERTIVGASPETLIRVDGRKMLYRPIAGTRKRTGDPATDERMKQELLSDEKERCEHQMLVDLGRNDLGRVAKIGSVSVQNAFHLEQYAHVFHIVSDITAELRDDLNALDALASVFPAGTLTGAPKLRAVEILSKLEKSPRGIYGGAFGYIDLKGNIDFAISIRTMLFDHRGISLRVGAGIVKDSIPECEDDECMHKAKSCLAAVFSAINPQRRP